MATDVERLVVRLEATQRTFEKQLARANGVANRRARQIESRFERMNKRLGASLGGIGKRFVAGLAAGITMREIVRLTDAATRIDNALKVAGLSGVLLDNVYAKLRDSAIANAAPLETLAKLYGTTALAQKELNVTQEEMISFSRNVAVALRVSGKSAEESRGALIQLSQAIGAGVVRAEEFNAILEGALPIAQAAAAGLEEAGGSVAALRRLIIDGKVSSEAFFRAFEAGSVILEDKVANATFTVDQSMVNLRNSLIDAAREFNRATGAGDRLAGGINNLANVIANFDIAGFIGKITDAHGAVVSFFNTLGNLGVFEDLNRALGITDESGNLFNPDLTEAKQEVAALEKEVELLQSRIAENAELGFDNADALAQLDQVMARLAQVRASMANIPETMPDPISGESKVDFGIGPSGRGGKRRKQINTVRLSDFAAPTKKKGGGGRRSSANEAEREREAVARLIAELELERSLIGATDVAREKANALRRAGSAATEKQKERIAELVEQIAQEEDALRRSKETMEEISDIGQDFVGGFIRDLQSGTSAAEALSNALSRVADKLLDIALSSVFGGGGFGNLLGGIFGFADGGIASRGRPHGPPLKRYAGGGVSRTAAIFGEAGPEAAVPLPDGRRIPVDLRLPKAGGSQGMSLNMPINIDARNADAPALARLTDEVRGLKRELPRQVKAIIHTQQVRGV